jgi:sensor c-di-GMP phosphodiesterase-like protein
MELTKKEKLLSIATALFAAVLSIALFTLLSYWFEHKKQHKELLALSESAFEHTHSVMLEFESGFKALREAPASGCSQKALDQLRATVKNSKYLKSASIQIGQNTYCTDIGLVNREKPSPDYVTQDGTLVWLNKANLYSKSLLNTAYIQRINIVLSTLQAHFLNIITEKDIHIVMLSSISNQIIARHPATAAVNPEITKLLIGQDKSYQDKAYLYNAKHDEMLSFTVITYRPKKALLAFWLEAFWLWLPIGLLCGSLAGYAMYKRIELQYSPIQKMLSAIKNKHFVVHYQPIISLHNGKCIGAETLIRWQTTDGSLINPDDFIPLAEDTGMIEALTDLTFDIAIRDLANDLKNGNFYISINLSASDMSKPRFFDRISPRLQTLGISAHKIAIEATERGFMDVLQANEVIGLFRKAGHAILIDDFGTGYSSLSTLQNLAIDVIKIDKTFVDAIDTGSATSSVITHIIAMAKQLNLKTIAEGVETQSQADFLRQHGVDAVQGYYFAEPMPANQFLSYIEQSRELADL